MLSIVCKHSQKLRLFILSLFRISFLSFATFDINCIMFVLWQVKGNPRLAYLAVVPVFDIML